MSLIGTLKLIIQQKKWRSENKHNQTNIINLFNIDQVTVGKGTYGGLYVLTHGVEAKLKIGNYCSIGPQVAFVLQSDHSMNHISTYPFKVMSGLSAYEAITKGDIIVDDDVWIGLRTIVLSGVHIGKGSVIGAGSVITKDIPPYSIVVGSPGKVIGSRFSEDVISILESIDISQIRNANICKLEGVLYQDINNVNDAMIVKNAIEKKKREV